MGEGVLDYFFFGVRFEEMGRIFFSGRGDVLFGIFLGLFFFLGEGMFCLGILMRGDLTSHTLDGCYFPIRPLPLLPFVLF